ncbi:MAG: ribosome recycling factor [Bacteroidia bacterium]|nr:ribosome recycling factor [Bacteroidia bacterium]
MNEDSLNSLLAELTASFEKNINHTIVEFSRIRAGKAQPAMLEGVMVDYYGNPTPLSQVANISAPESRTLMIQPWEKSLLGEIERAIINSNLGFAPGNDGMMIRISIPPLTEERRLQLVKTAKAEGENSKVSARSIRKDINERIKKLQKDGLSEDEAKDAEVKVQKQIDAMIIKIDQLLADKEKEIMTV